MHGLGNRRAIKKDVLIWHSAKSRHLFLFCKNAEKCDKIEENSFSLLDITSNKVYNKYRIKEGRWSK